jgi:hypothetical protein
VLLSPLLNGGDGAYPWFGSVYGGTGIAAGGGFLKHLERASYFNAQAGASINGSMVMRGTVAAPELWRGMLHVDATAQWFSARNLSFYGLGRQSDARARERYNYTPMDIGGNVTLKPVRPLSLTGSYNFLNFATDRREPRDDRTGLDRNLTYHVTRGTIAYDWRPAPGYSTRGGYYRATFEHNDEANGLPYSFNAQEYEAVQLVPLLKEQFVLAAHALVTLTSTSGANDVPVVMAPFLGSGATLRAFANRRFTDRNRALVTGEYRWRPSRYVDMAVFLDAGQVSPDHHFDTDAFDVAWGVGARFHGPAFNALRIDVARGREGLRLIFAGSQPF